jgi:DNA polymerase-3 subunit alpha
MAYLTIEDLLGTVEVIVFPRDYEQNASVLEQDAKVFVQGRVSCEDDKPSRLICEKIIPFDQEKKELWIQFADKEAFQKQEVRMLNSLKAYEGDVTVVAYLAKEKQWKKYPPNRNISLTDTLLETLKQQFGEQNIKVRTIKAL